MTFYQHWDKDQELTLSYETGDEGPRRCLFCMGPMHGRFCAVCGKERMQMNGEDDLPAGTVLWNGGSGYLVGRVLGRGGFGITYLGWDMRFNRKVAVKEFFHKEYAGRDPLTHVEVAAMDKEIYQRELEDFRSEAVKLAQYSDSPETAALITCFSANETAYMIMTYVDGITLEKYVETNGPVSFAQAWHLLDPLMKFLYKIHQDGLIHRDISSTNILIDRSGKAVLLDFGASRQYVKEDTDGYYRQNTEFPVILRYGFAPPEQYHACSAQTPGTDIYALAAVIYFMITGRVPVRADLREAGIDLPRPSAIGADITERQEQAV